MHPDEGLVAVFRLTNYQHAVYRHARGEMGEQVLAALFSEGAGKIFDFAELGTPYARIPLNGWVSLTAGQRHRNRAHEIEVQDWPRRFCHLHWCAIGVDTE